LVDALGLHRFICKKAPPQADQPSLNDLIAGAVASACIPVSN